MWNRKNFFDRARADKLLGPTLTQSEVDGCNAILSTMDSSPIAFASCALATAYLETWHTMQPIQEKGSSDYFFRMYDIKGNRPEVARRLGNLQPGDGVRYCGRGLVQLTGRGNYAKAERELGIPLVATPALALDDNVAAKIMGRGMLEGWFTGVGFATYLPQKGNATRAQYYNSRRIINRVDRADEFAGYCLAFQGYLQ